ncbi:MULTISPECIES: tRNA 2-selenouridine(34) synthase MnmH [unclassified Campylobacter]|uniref:tRNA 2-selenouridine(34) synthase MnmH n=1 Tax=unclassified Campylobacter TaxID=2593542 RepID=UPI003D331F65
MLIELEISDWLKTRSEFDLLIDARSPNEFLYSNIASAKNFYALNDAQHKETGTLYKENRASAKVLGATYISQNIATHLQQIAQISRVGSMVGIYCARGGMRSSSIAHVLDMIGYRVVRLVGGYKAYREHVLRELNAPCDINFITLFGNTGSYKTKLIERLEPSINLEKMANHLGSVFGAIGGAQPSQKAFEDELFEKILSLKEQAVKTCFIEGESRRIGALTLPASIYEAMRNGVNIQIIASMPKRVECTMKDYAKIDDSFFYECMRKITPFISSQVKSDAINAYEDGNIAKVCEILLEKYYDKVYKKQQRIDHTICSDDLETAVNELMKIYHKQNMQNT